MDNQVSKELIKINSNSKDEKELFPEHEFLVTCLRLGLKIDDLKILTYVDVLKMFISFLGIDNKTESRERKATKEEINKLVAMM